MMKRKLDEMEDNQIEEFCYDQQIIKDSAEKHNAQRKSGKYCDYVIKTDDGGEFSTHKSILEAASIFFEKLFNSELNDKEKETVLLKNCSSDVMEKIIEYMYTGKIKITSEIAKQTLDTALFLQLYVLVDACTKVLIKTANSENCFELLSYSETYHRGETLTAACMKVIWENLESFLDNSTEFVKLAPDVVKLLHLYCEDDDKDEKLFRAIMKWITFDMAKRENFISELLDKINFQNMSYEFRLNNVLKNNPLIYKEGFVNKVAEFLREDWGEQCKNSIHHNEPQHLYFIVDGKIILYNHHETMLFSRVITQICNNVSHFGYSTFGKKNLFICGGDKIFRGNTNECNYFSMNENRWKNLPPMKYTRCYHQAITLNNKIYSCFGYNTSTIEIFDIIKMQWNSGPSFEKNFGIYNGLCSHNDNIYALGRQFFVCLDTRTDKWIELQTPQSKSIFSTINYNNKIYAFDLIGIKTYDIIANKWLEDVKFYSESNIYDPLTCLLNNKIYVLGKTIDKNFRMKVYDPSDLSILRAHVISPLKNDVTALFSI